MNLIFRFLRRTPALTGILALLCVVYSAQAGNIEDADRLFRQGKHGAALEMINGLLSSKPRDAQARFLKGLILAEQGQVNEAIGIFAGLTEDYPELPEPYNNLAVLYASQGHYDKARQALEKAIRTHPSYATAHENLGDIYAKMASQAYDRALKIDNNNMATQIKLAMIGDLFARKDENPNVSAGKVASAAHTKSVAPISPVPNNTETVTVVPLPTVATKTSDKPASPGRGDEQEVSGKAKSTGDISKVLDDWAAAWSAQDVKAYLSFYADDFRTPNGESREAWEKLRKERVSKPKSIRVTLGKPVIKFADKDHATARFRQIYDADHFKANGSKTLSLVRSGGKWLIQEESSK